VLFVLKINIPLAAWRLTNVRAKNSPFPDLDVMSITDGVLTPMPMQSNEMRVVRVTDSTILDTAKLNQIAEAGGASAYTSRGMRPDVSLIDNSSAGGAAWYFNYSDPETQKNVLTIIIDANSGRIVFKDAK
jgi:hypothetical protein